MYQTLKNMIKRSFQSSSLPDNGNFSVSQTSYYGKTSKYEQIYHYGYSANAPIGTFVLLFDVNAQEQNLAGIPYGSKERFKGLKAGEVMIGNPVKKTSIKFDELGNITINAPDENIIIESAKDINIKSGININIESSEKVNITSSEVNIISDEVNITSTGSTTLTASDLTIENDTTINGKLTVNGQIQDVTGKLMSSIITNYNSHTHISGAEGAPTGTTSVPV